MQKPILLALGLLAAGPLTAQTVTDTVSIGAGYANQVYYSLSEGPVHTAPTTNWDLAFQANLYGAAIRANHVGGVEVYDPGVDASAWATVLDTNEADTWTAYYNADTAWETGAFDAAGWYTYQGSGLVIGTKVFALKLGDGRYKKLLIDGITNGGSDPAYAIVFRYADVDGSNEVVDTLVKPDYATQNFIYYSLADGAVVAQEPADRATWDLVFTQYLADLGGMPYPVTGVLHNYIAAAPYGGSGTPPNVLVAEVSDVAVEEASDSGQTYASAINTIGYDWKAFNMTKFTYDAVDSLSYFVRAMDGQVYHVAFTGFGGSADGTFIFTKTLMRTTAADDRPGQSSLRLSVYPNPTASSAVTVAYAATEATATLQLHDVLGREVWSGSVTGPTALGTYTLPSLPLRAGTYLLSMQSGTHRVSQRVVLTP
ncbi:Por secretion system C-terminal sorting domain-containing protein [Catalinimonas alkaloidigena]|uniref:Por secretion system C-terminal sorting domain-containing protein n=1 Tax=Catalinimonas alkaloidigena TaxID=1075417 RepID=A0A1G9KDZ8_9BACT|nr:T9SS type A sorting domain-containing protein [Catalinimonas alkaloidigena]SDL47829.1 Por secretion system C-terminal sorting domain-containing protein [Catalinimonas alkaloidigena]